MTPRDTLRGSRMPGRGERLDQLLPQLRLNLSTLRHILEQMHEGVYVVDRDRRIVYWNAAAERLTGYGRGRVVGSRCQENLLRHVTGSGVQLCHVGCPLAATIEDGEPRTADVYIHHADGHREAVTVRVAPLFGDSGQIVGAIETFTLQDHRHTDHDRIRRLERMAFLDPLTGIANRRYGEAALESRLEDLDRRQWPFGLLMLDIDRFKSINDRFGHGMGDRVLQTTARTLSACCGL